MARKMTSIRDILALNLKENRRICGLTQEKLAEKAGISAHYLAMVEVSRKFPTPEMLDRLAKALNIQTFQLFDPSVTPEGALLQLEQSIINSVETVLKTTVKQDILSEINQTVSNAVRESLPREGKKVKKR